ncbi:MAG TPA: NAD(P)/FAD-dependent oxidoreductase [Acidimicrobiales bacterium]|nr:NAD(P)/FAD-dependent oxidoreductase [Acidimicrobiales bacterium]
MSIAHRSGTGHDDAHYDAIVVGARAAGASTALLLARHGLRVLVVDRARPGADTLSTHALLRPAVLQLRRWGLLDEIAASGSPPIRRTIIHYGDDVVAVDISARNGVDAFYAPRRTVLDPVLARAAARAGAEVRYETSVGDLVRDRSGRVAGVELRAADGHRSVARAPITIGADGVRSTVARRVAAPSYWHGREGGGVAYAYFEGLDIEGYEWLYRPGVAGALIPTNDGQVNVSVTVPAATFATRLRSDVEGGFWRVLAEADPDVAARVRRARRVSRFRSFPGLAAFQRQAWGPGWALVGDAGSFMDPTGAHGISSALRDSDLLARAVLAVHTGVAAEDEALAGYQQTRDDLTSGFFAALDAVTAWRWDLTELRQRLLAMSAEMGREADALERLDLPTAARRAA